MDYLKYDNCYNQGLPAKERYAAMAEAIRKTGRPIVYSICEWGSNDPWLWGAEVGGHLWRTTGDIYDAWESVTSIIDQQVGLEKYSGPNAWNDPDMLEVGNGGMSDTEYRAHMSVWALLNSPLLAGNDLRAMSDSAREILTNSEVIAVNQDWGGTQGYKLRDDGDTEVWMKPMSDGSRAVVLLNRSATTAAVSTTASELGLKSSRAYAVRDLWSQETRASSGTVRGAVPSHGAAMYVVRPTTAGGTFAPAVMLAPTAPAYVAPGDAATVTTTVYNDGTTAIEELGVGLEAPAGWTARPQQPTTADSVAPGKAMSVKWSLMPAEGVEPGQVEFRSHASYLHREDTHTETANATTTLVEPVPAGTHNVSDLAWISATNGWGPVERNTSNGEASGGDGGTISIASATYAKGLGVHATSVVTYFLGSDCSRVSALVGIDDETHGLGTVTFEIYGDGRRLAGTEVVRGGQSAVPLEAELSNIDVLELRVSDGGDGKNYDHADWANPRITCA